MKRAFSFLVLIIADLFSLVVSFAAAYFIRVKVMPLFLPGRLPSFFPVEHFYRLSFMLLVFILIFFYERLYTRRFDGVEEFIYIVRGIFISVFIIAVFIYFSRTFEVFARTIWVLMLFTGIIFVPLGRYLAKKILIFSRIYVKKTIVFGLEDQINKVLPTLKKAQTSGYAIVDIIYLGDKNREKISEMPEKCTYPQIIEDKQIDTVIIVSPGLDKDSVDLLINECEPSAKEIKIVSDVTYLKTIGVQTEYWDELLIIRMANNLLSPLNRFFKRLVDTCFSLLIILLLFPLWLIISLVIKLESPGPVLFIQERFGRRGKKFKLLKFRSMYRDADNRLKDFLKQNPQFQVEWDTYKKLKSADPRVTRIGKFLRRFSLDELPQIFNVLKGDMSIVGPRPYLIREREEIQKSAAIIFKVHSGLTGLWQIRGRSEISFDERLKLDEFYVRNWSFFLDILIIFKTFGVVIRGKGAY